MSNIQTIARGRNRESFLQRHSPKTLVKKEVKLGSWRLSNHKFTFRVITDNKGNVIDAAPIAKRFIGGRFEAVCKWMQNIGPTDIILLRRYEHDTIQD